MRTPSLLIVLALLAAGCGSKTNTDLPDFAVGHDVPVGTDEGPSGFDRSPPRDYASPSSPIYAHDKEQLFLITPPSFDLTMVGSFGVMDDITDLAVGPDGSIFVISNTALYEASRTDGTATKIADVGGMGNVALTFLPGGGLLASDQQGGVRSIDPTTGEVTEVGSYGDGLATAGDLVAVGDGTLYGISDMGAPDAATSNILLTVDGSTGRARRVGPIGFGKVWGMAYSGGKVYAFTKGGEIIEIDPATGAGTLKRKHPVEFWGAGVTPLIRPQG